MPVIAPVQPAAPILDWKYAMNSKVDILVKHPELKKLYAKAEAAIKLNPQPRQANFEHAYAAIVEKVKAYQA